MTGFGALVTGALSIRENPLLTKLDGFAALTNIPVALVLANNDELVDIEGFGSLAVVRGLGITDHARLAGLGGLATLRTVETIMHFSGNSALASFKALTSRAVEDRHRVNGWLWGRGFSDRLLDEGEDPRHAALALVDQPRRLGLVGRAGDYAYWNSAWWPPDEGPP